MSGTSAVLLEPPDGDCPDCCGAKPQFDDPFYTANYTGQVAVMTGNDLSTGSSYPVLTIFNLNCSPLPPIPGQEWNPVPGSPNTEFRYSGTNNSNNWRKDNLGSIFGVTLDGQGNVYVAHFGLYGVLNTQGCAGSSTAIGNASSPSPNLSTSVFKIPVGPGVPSVFVNLPGGTTNPAEPGLGNVHFDCEHQEFFVSHFGDGRIYRISPNGTILGSYDHFMDLVELGAAPDSAGPYTTLVPLGERVWAVQSHNGRLYYSVWGQNKADQSIPFTAVGTTPNRIWSIALLPSGNFDAGSRRQEIQPPTHPGNDYFPASLAASSPVSDISFSPSCRMLLAERDQSDECTLAHGARALEYALSVNGTAWVPTTYRNGYGYQIGEVVGTYTPPLDTNSAGGCDYDFITAPDVCSGRLWVTGDSLFQTSPSLRVYGLAGVLPGIEFGNPTALFIDYNDVYSTSVDKTRQGDVEIPCPKGCVEINDISILCETQVGPPLFTGNFIYKFTFINNTSPPQDIQYLFTPQNSGVTFNPLGGHSLALPNPVPFGQTSPEITVTISGQNPGNVFCFDLTFANPAIEVCCHIQHCVVLPECDCLQFPTCSVMCQQPFSGNYTMTFTVQNLFAFPINELHIFPLPIGSGVTATPADFYFPLVPPGGFTNQLSTTISGASPGQLCLRISVHLDGVECCSEVKCITIPECPLPGDCCGCNSGPPGCDNPACDAVVCAVDPFCCDVAWDPLCCEEAEVLCVDICDGLPVLCPGDCNGDGIVDVIDLLAVLGAWGPSPGNPSDIDGDGIIDVIDLLAVLGAWGPCG